jgi:hypothetical protein
VSDRLLTLLSRRAPGRSRLVVCESTRCGAMPRARSGGPALSRRRRRAMERGAVLGEPLPRLVDRVLLPRSRHPARSVQAGEVRAHGARAGRRRQGVSCWHGIRPRPVCRACSSRRRRDRLGARRRSATCTLSAGATPTPGARRSTFGEAVPEFGTSSPRGRGMENPCK